MKHQEVKSWVENEGIVSTVQCNRMISHGQDDPPPPPPPMPMPMPMQRSFSDLDLRPPPARPQPETKKVYVELSPHLDVEFGKPPKKTPKVELVPNHIFQYYVRSLHHEAVLRGKNNPPPQRAPPARKAHVEVKKFVEPPPPPLPEPQIIVQPPRPPQSEVRWAPDPVPQRRPKPILKEKKVIDPRVPKHWWQYNHPGKLVDGDDQYVATNPLPGNPGYNTYVQNVIEKRYVVDQVDQEDQVVANPIYAQVQRRGVTRNSSQRASTMSYDSPSWVSEYGSVDYSTVGAPQGRPRSYNGNYPGNRDSEIVVTGQNTRLIN